VGLQLGKICYERNALEKANAHVSQGLDLLKQSGMTDSFGLGHALLARIQQARGDVDGARVAIRRAVQIARTFDIGRISTLVSAYQARIWLAQKQLKQAARWARDYERRSAVEYLCTFEDLTLARIYLARRQAAEGLVLLDAMLAAAETAGRLGAVIEISVLRSLALHALGKVRQAKQSLRHALHLAEPEGYVRVFVNEGKLVTRLLQQTAVRGTLSQYVDRLLSVLGARDKGSGAMSNLLEPLSDREMQVLELIAEGLSNPEIALQLAISLPTVKSHTRNMYGKLGVHSRKQAVAKARNLGILVL
jgi:LuxR family maltose regulon positive regulatory protein